MVNALTIGTGTNNQKFFFFNILKKKRQDLKYIQGNWGFVKKSECNANSKKIL